MIHSLHDPIVSIILSKTGIITGTKRSFMSLIPAVKLSSMSMATDSYPTMMLDLSFIDYQQSIPDNFHCPLKPCRWPYVGGTL
jgi:hypothetical protein